MSESDGVKVTITGDAGGFTDATTAATDAANNFGQAVGKMAQNFVPDASLRYQQAINELGRSLKDLNPVWLETGQGAMRLSDQMAAAAAASAAASGATQTAAKGAAEATEEQSAAQDRASQSTANAARMADMLARGLDPLIARQVLIRENAERVAAEVQRVANAFAGYKEKTDSAAASASAFVEKLNPSPLIQTRTLMGDNAAAADKLTRSLAEQRLEMDRQTRGLSAEVIGILRVREAAGQTAAAFQDLTNKFAGVTGGFHSAEESARTFQQALDPTPLQKLKGLMAETEDQTGRSSRATSGLVREFIVLGHEGIVGNWTRIPGTLLVMTEYSEGLRNAIVNMITSFSAMQTVGVAAIGAVAASFVYLAVRAHEATTAINEATNAAVMQGRSPETVRAAMKGYADQWRDVGVMSETSMIKVSSSIQQLGQRTEEQRTRIAAMGPELFLNWGRDADKTGEEIQKIFGGTSAGLKSYLDQNTVLSVEQTRAWSRATSDAERFNIGLDAITARLGGMRTAIKQAGDDAKLNIAMVALGGVPQAGDQSILPPQRLGDFKPGTQQPDPSLVVDQENVDKLNKHYQERLDIEAQLASAKRILANASTDEQRADAQAAIGTAETALQMWKALGDTSWQSKQENALLAQLTAINVVGKTTRQVSMEENQIRIDFWTNEAQRAGATAQQVTTAQNNAYRATLALEQEKAAATTAGAATWLSKQNAALSEILVGLQAHATSTRGLAEEENKARIKFWDDLVKAGGLTERELLEAQAQGNRARLSLRTEELAGSIAAGKQDLAARLATLSAEQATYHDNYAKVMAIEDQKIAMLRAAGAAETKQLEDELIKQANLRREHAAKVLALAEQTLAANRQEDTASIAQLREQLNEEVTERTISKNQEMQQLRAFAAEKHSLELKGLEDLLATIDPQLAAYTTLYNKIRVLKQQWLSEDKKMNAEGTADLQRQWDASTAPISSAIDGQVGAMLRGTQTIGQSVRNVLGNIVIGYAEMGVKAAQHWAASQLMQLFVHQSTEAAKTGSSVAGAAARSTVAAGETATENAGLLVRVGRWIATQLGMTGATAAGATAREGVLTAEQIAATEATGLAARLNIAAAAAVAAAWAFADSAQLGPPGLAAAPGVAAGAYGAVMAYQLAVPSLDVGAWNVPRDMMANIHAGEMVVPANFASGMRGGGVGGATNNVNLNYGPKISGGGDPQSLLRSQSGEFKSYLWHATRNGSLKLPGR